ncbi:MAG: molybdopterin-binding protein [Pseudomonadota bacterium]
MEFGPVSITDAEGSVLAHSLETPVRRIKKGTVLDVNHLNALQQAGFRSIIVARLAKDDVSEDEAAQTLALALCGSQGCLDADATEQGLKAVSVSTGRVNLHATHDGVVFADRIGVNAFNTVDPAITLATLADGTGVKTGDMVATLKIIPFAVSEASVQEAAHVAQEAHALRVAPPEHMQVVLIQTRLPGVKESVLDKTRRHLEKRLALSSASLLTELRMEHETNALTQAMAEAMETPNFMLERDSIIVFGASAICDAHDVIPTALEQAGGTVTSFGMPVDPGNLLMVGRLGGSFVIGAPGCARSPAENGFDWVLARIAHCLPVGPDYIAGLGVGGLLKEIKSRPQPRDPQNR